MWLFSKLWPWLIAVPIATVGAAAGNAAFLQPADQADTEAARVREAIGEEGHVAALHANASEAAAVAAGLAVQAFDPEAEALAAADAAGLVAAAPAAAPGPASAAASYVQLHRAAAGQHLPAAGITEEQCGQFEKAIVLKPPATCRLIRVDDLAPAGCTCTIYLPHNTRIFSGLPPAPSVDVTREVDSSSSSTYAPLPPQHLPETPNRPYEAPVIEAQCPFARDCRSKSYNCVGIDSWGFAEVHMAEHSSVSSYLKSITCTYVVALGGFFKVPVQLGSNELQAEIAESVSP
jgi:hypothetical protein